MSGSGVLLLTLLLLVPLSALAKECSMYYCSGGDFCCPGLKCGDPTGKKICIEPGK
uniref:Conotoxin Cal6.40 n=1 Tax=Californiconus californicus TaxID=1736779 RepID=C640_CONCL|nr:RecName: Full=Conotoxin Cal6.40; AltName: Full=O3_cal6.2; Flags: Precursor [Californiconus californicus]